MYNLLSSLLPDGHVDHWSGLFPIDEILDTVNCKDLPFIEDVFMMEIHLDLRTMQLNGTFMIPRDADGILEYLNSNESASGIIPYSKLSFRQFGGRMDVKFIVMGKAFDKDTGVLKLQVHVSFLELVYNREPDRLEEYYVNGILPVYRFNGRFIRECRQTCKDNFVPDFPIGETRERIVSHCEYIAMCFESEGSRVTMFEDRDADIEDGRIMVVRYDGLVPDQDRRQRLMDLISLYIGRHMIPLGEASFKDGEACRIRIVSAFRYEDQKDTCTLSPIPHDVTLGEFLDDVLPGYEDLYSRYDLGTFFTLYWRALSLEIDVTMTQMATILEHLAERHVATHEPESSMMTDEAYRTLISDELDSISRKLAEVEGGEVIFEKIMDAVRGSKRNRLRKLGQELGVEFDRRRKNAYKNAMNLKHADSPKNMVSEDFLIMLGYTDEIVLRLLGYRGGMELLSERRPPL